MARYRVGDKYLSESEYEQHIQDDWTGKFFILGSLVLGLCAYIAINDIVIVKWAKFLLIFISSLLGGTLFAVLQKVIRKIFVVSVAIGLIYLVGVLIWESL